MNLAALFLHNMRDGVCPAWGILGEVGEPERVRINEEFAKYVQYEQFAGFNEWHIRSYGDGKFSVKRFTWEMHWYGTLDEIFPKLADYYDRTKTT